MTEEYAKLNRDYSDAPASVARLPKDERGFPIPYFVDYIDGKPDFRVMDPRKWEKCVTQSKCWITGEPMGAYKTFVIGPMCGVNRTSAEPPAKKEAAIFAAKHCPFLALPKMVRNERGLPEETKDAPGIAIKRNPGVTLLWTTRSYELFRAGSSYLIEIGPPENIEFYAKGRHATPEEITASVKSGLPSLVSMAREEEGGIQALNKFIRRFAKVVDEHYGGADFADKAFPVVA